MPMSKFTRFATATALGASLFLGSPASAAKDPKVAAEIMALARAQWASEMAGQTAGQQMAAVADDYTEFNADYPTLLMGKAMVLKMADITPETKSVFSEMQNPNVQVYGDTAILTYNYAGMTKSSDGKIKPNTAKSTRVYAKEGGRWMLVHANFAPVRGAAD